MPVGLAQARLHAPGEQNDIQKQLEELDELIRGIRATISSLQRDPETEPPLIVRLGDLPDTAPVDGVDVNVMYLTWAGQLPDTTTVPKLEELCKDIGLPEAQAEEPTVQLDLSPESQDCVNVSGQAPSRPETLPVDPHAGMNAVPQKLSVPWERIAHPWPVGSAKESTEAAAPTAESTGQVPTATPRPIPDPVDRTDWQAVHARRLLAKLAGILGISDAEYVGDAEARWRAEMPADRASRMRRRSEIRADIKHLELRKQDLIASQGIPDPIRLDLYQRYGTSEIRKLDKLLKNLRELQHDRRLHESRSNPRRQKPK